MGHVVRSMAFASKFAARGWKVCLVGSGAQKARNFAKSFRDIRVLHPSEKSLDHISALYGKPAMAVVDGYHYSREFFESLSDLDLRYGVVDDNSETLAPHPFFVLNQNPQASADLYRHLPSSIPRFLGLDFALLREEIVQQGFVRTERQDYVLVSFGGTDPLGAGCPVARTLREHGHRVHIARGSAASSKPGRDYRSWDHANIQEVEASSFVSHLATCKVAVLAAGSTLWEAAYLDTQVVAVIVADNQAGPAMKAYELGLVQELFDAREMGITELSGKIARSVSRLLAKNSPRHGKHLERIGQGLEIVLDFVEQELGLTRN